MLGTFKQVYVTLFFLRLPTAHGVKHLGHLGLEHLDRRFTILVSGPY